MAVGPIHTSRISFQHQTQQMLETMRRGRLELFTQQNRLSSGRRFLSPGDDPIAAGRSLRLQEILDQQVQFVANARHGSTFLDAADDAAADIDDLLNEAHTIASQNVGSTASADERAAAAQLVASIREQLVNIGNRQFNGRYLFAGRNSTEQPFVSALGGVAYLGDRGDLLTRVSQSEFEPFNVTGETLFGALASRVSGSADLDPGLTAETRLDALNGATGRGVTPGVLVFNEIGGAGVVSVDIATANTVGDVIDLINAAATAAGASFTADVGTDGIDITPGSDLTITGQSAADLGILTPAPASATITGADLGVRLTPTTRIDELAAGAGMTLDGLVITNGTQSATLDLSGAETIQEVLNVINSAGLHVRAEINADGTGIDVLNLVSGTVLTITEDTGTTAMDLGILSLNPTMPLASLNFGQGLNIDPNQPDLRITARDGSTLDVELDAAVTVQDLIDAINTAASAASVSVTAAMSANGDGISLQDATGGPGTLSVFTLSPTVNGLALGLAASTQGSQTELVLKNINTQPADSVFNILLDLEHALASDDTVEITAAGERLSEIMEDVRRTHGLIGVQARGMHDRVAHMESSSSVTEAFLSEIRDLDYAEAATLFQQAQVGLQASMLTGSQLMSLSLMDFLR